MMRTSRVSLGQTASSDRLQSIEWRFEEPQPAWKPAAPWNPNVDPVHLTRTEDALRVTLTERTRNIEDQP